ncbi:MAG: c-type cytochrome domain-containing protein [Planctomycetota bacterium]
MRNRLFVTALVLLAVGCSSSDDDEQTGLTINSTAPTYLRGNVTAEAWTVNGIAFDATAVVSTDVAGATVDNITVVSPTQLTFELTSPNTVVAGTGQVMVTTAEGGTATFTLPTIPETVTLSGEVQPILTASCTGCHSGVAPSAGLNLSSGVTHGATVGVASTGIPTMNLITAGDPDASYLIDKIQNTQTVGVRMPPNGPPLTPTQIALIRVWAADGALDN